MVRVSWAARAVAAVAMTRGVHLALGDDAILGVVVTGDKKG
jgi:hypothetical protein